MDKQEKSFSYTWDEAQALQDLTLMVQALRMLGDVTRERRDDVLIEKLRKKVSLLQESMAFKQPGRRY